MDRRHFLTGLAGSTAFVAGCSTRAPAALEGDPDSPENRSPLGVDTEAVPGDSSADDESSESGRDPGELIEELHEDPSVVDFETAPLSVTVVGGQYRTDDRLSATVELTSPATADEPATVAIVLVNGESYEQTVRLRRFPGFDDPPLGRTDDRDSIYLAPTENHELVDPETAPAYERDDDGRWRVVGPVGGWLPETATLGPDEAIVGEYHLLGHFDSSERPLEAGTYRFGYRDAEFTVVAWETDAPGPDGSSTLSKADPPGLPNADETAWWNHADPSSTVYLEPSAEALEAPGRIDFDLVNHSRETLSGNPYAWGLYKLADGEWFRIEPWTIPMPLSFVEPGAVDESSLRLYYGDPVPCSDARVVGHVGGGRYAYHVGYSRDEETYAALFDLDAPDVTVEPDEDLTVQRESDQVTVTMPEWGQEGHPPDATLTLERTGEDVDDRVIPEQLSRRHLRGLRNALVSVEAGVDRVVLRADRHVVTEAVGYGEDRRRFEYEGETYEAVARVDEA